MAKGKIYKTVLMVEVLHDDVRDFGQISFADILYGIDEGSDSGKFTVKSSNAVLSGKKAVKAILDQGSETEFFGLDGEGNIIDENYLD